MTSNVQPFAAQEGPGLRVLEAMRVVEAILFASREPLSENDLVARVPTGVDIKAVLERLQALYSGRGVVLARVAGKWVFRTAPDLAPALTQEREEPRKLSRAAMETLAIIAYHQPVTRAEIEEVRGVATSRGTLDALMEAGWIRLRGRRRSPGRPVTYGTTPDFLIHFGLEAIDDLPGLDDLKGAGFIEGRLPKDFSIPVPDDQLGVDEDELADDDDGQ